MTDKQWNELLSVINGERIDPLPYAFIIDSPWLPNWANMTILDYFENSQYWFDANMKAIREFPDCWFLPGFWAEYGMCTETSAFGTPLRWEENSFPFPQKIIHSIEEIESLDVPDPKKDGLLPFVIKRLQHFKNKIEAEGHRIRFSISRGPLNIASFLMGSTEFLMALKTNTQEMHAIIAKVTEFVTQWHTYQKECFPSIEGMFLLDDIVGFLGEEDFKAFVLPYFKDVYHSMDVSVKFFHNDSPCVVSAPYLDDMGVNLLNFGIQNTLGEIRDLAGPKVTLMGNVPPREVFASGTPEDVKKSVAETINTLDSTDRFILSCGGGMPPGTPRENILAMKQSRFHKEQ